MIQNNTSGGLTIASTIADNTSATGLTKSGSGNLTLTAANSYTGQTTLNSGTLTLGNDAALGTGAILINNGAALDTTASRTLSGNNSQTWRGNFTYLGTGSANLNVGTGAVTLNAAPVANSLDPAITVTVNSGSLTVGGVIGDSGLRYGITKVGAGSLVLGGSNTFTGITTASAGRLVLANSAALQNSTLFIGGTGTTVAFDQSVSSNAFAVGGLAGTGALTLNTNAIVTNSTGPQGVTLTVGGNNASTYFNGGLISGIGGITKTGGGTLFLRDSASSNTNFLGTITLNAGTLFLEAGNGGNPMSRGWFVINGGTLDSAGPGGGSQTFGQYVNGDFTYAGSVGSMTLTPAATSLFLSGSRTITVAANSLISSGRLFDAAAGTGLTKVGPGLLGLGGANNYFTGPITVSEGVLLLSNTAAAYSSTLSVSSGAAVQFDSAVTGNTFRIGALGGAGDVPLMNTSGSSISLFVGGNNASTSYSGLLSGSGSLIKQGTGVMTLSAANTYSGTTAINGGTLALDFSAPGAPATNILSSTTPLAIAGGTLNLVGAASTTNSQTVTGLTVNSGAGSIRLSGSTANPLSLSVGAITRNVGGTLDLTQPAGTIGATNGMVTTATNSNGILGGWMTVGGSDWAFNDGTNVVALSSYTNDAWGSGVNTTVTASGSLSAATTNSLRFNNAGAAALTLSGSNTITSGDHDLRVPARGRLRGRPRRDPKQPRRQPHDLLDHRQQHLRHGPHEVGRRPARARAGLGRRGSPHGQHLHRHHVAQLRHVGPRLEPRPRHGRACDQRRRARGRGAAGRPDPLAYQQQHPDLE